LWGKEDLGEAGEGSFEEESLLRLSKPLHPHQEPFSKGDWGSI